MSENLLLTGFTLPAGWNPGSWQEVMNTIASNMVAVFPGTSNTFNDGNGTPTPENRAKPWIYRDGTTGVGRLYTWSNVYSLWISEYRAASSTLNRMLWLGTEAQLKTFDEGVDEPVDDVHGPFWEVDHDFDFRSPMGPGTSPDGTVLAVAANLGEEKHTQTADEVAAHNHAIAGSQGIMTFPGNHGAKGTESGNDFSVADATLVTQNNTFTSPATAAAAMSIVHPVRGAFMAKRTARLYWRRTG